MGDLILSAGFFTGEATEKFVCFNQAEVDAAKSDASEDVEPIGAYFSLKPVDGKLDAEYTKLRGQDVKTMRVRPRADRDDEGPNCDFEPMEMSFSNEREIKAMEWLAKRVVTRWRKVMLDDGNELPFTEKNLELFSRIPQFIKPVLEAAYELGKLQDQLTEGNFETS
jgi:hypothetical protein